MSKRFYNPNGMDKLDEPIIGGSNTGFVDFNKPRYKWSASLYDLMQANTWFPQEVNTNNEQKNFNDLNENEQNIYKMTFAQLSFNDSAQEENILDFRALANNRIVKASLTVQAMQEVNHSKSYAVLLDACGNSDEVFELYRYDATLSRKNQRIAEQFARYLTKSATKDEILLASMNSVNLEGIYFLSGFGFVYLLGDKVPGARDMIALIARDEINTHLPLYANVFKTIIKENDISSKTIDKCYELVQEAVDTELEYCLYLFEKYPILGTNKEELVTTIHNFANDRLEKIGLKPLYEIKPQTYIQKLIIKHLELNTVKTNFFEGNVKNYSKATLDMSDF